MEPTKETTHDRWYSPRPLEAVTSGPPPMMASCRPWRTRLAGAICLLPWLIRAANLLAYGSLSPHGVRCPDPDQASPMSQRRPGRRIRSCVEAVRDRHRARRRHAVDPEGEFLAVVGRSGAGKSSLLR